MAAEARRRNARRMLSEPEAIDSAKEPMCSDQTGSVFDCWVAVV